MGPIAEEYPEVLPHALAVSSPGQFAITSDGIPIFAWSGHMGSTDSWFCLRLRLKSSFCPAPPRRHTRKSNACIRQRHEIIAGGLEFVYQWGQYIILPSGED